MIIFFFFSDAVIDYGEKAGKIRDEQFQIQFEQDYILNNKVLLKNF